MPAMPARARSCSHHSPDKRQTLRTHHATRPVLDLGAWLDVKIRNPSQELGNGDFHFQACKVCTHATVHTTTKCQGWLAWPVKVHFSRVFKYRRVIVGGRQDGSHPITLLHLDPV